MAIFGIDDGSKDAMLDALRARIDAGAGAGQILCYTGPQPAIGGALTTQTLVAAITLAEPAGEIDGSHRLAFFPAGPAVAVSTGEVEWCRVVDGDGNFRADGDAGQADLTIRPTGVFKLERVQVFAGGLVSLTAGTIAIP